MTTDKAKTISVRGLTAYEVMSLKEYASKSHFNSVNAFLLNLIRDELGSKAIARYGTRTIKYIEDNATALNNMIKSQNSFMADYENVMEQVTRLLNILSE